MCCIAFSPLVQAYLSRINQPFVPRNMARLKCLVCSSIYGSSLPVSEVRPRFLSRSFRRRSLSSCTAKSCTHIAPRAVLAARETQAHGYLHLFLKELELKEALSELVLENVRT